MKTVWGSETTILGITLPPPNGIGERNDTYLPARALSNIVKKFGGTQISTQNEMFVVSFPKSGNALHFALEVITATLKHGNGEPRLRSSLQKAAVHHGWMPYRQTNLPDPILTRLEALFHIAHPGQILLTEAAESVVARNVPEGGEIVEIGCCLLADLYGCENVWQVVHPALPSNHPPPNSLNRLPNNLPTYSMPLVGRKLELQFLRQRLEDSRLVTLTGDKGIGKTRLALHLAAAFAHKFPNGVWLMPVGSLSHPSEFLFTLLSILHLREEQGRTPLQTVRHYLADKEVLLILDDHDAHRQTCQEFVASFLATCPRLKVITTGLTRMNLSGEIVVNVPPLASPDMTIKGEADEVTTTVQMENFRNSEVGQYIAQLGDVSAKLGTSDTNILESLAPLYKLVNGNPLAIEMVGTVMETLPLEWIRACVTNICLTSGYGVRTNGSCQETVECILAWRYSLLSNKQKTLFRRMSVFQGGFSMDAAAAVCSDTRRNGASKALTLGGRGLSEILLFGDESEPVRPREVPEILNSLVALGLVVQMETATQKRYILQSSIRKFCLAKSAASKVDTENRRRHFDYFLEFAEIMEERYSNSGNSDYYINLDAELHNLRVAVGHGLSAGSSPEAMNYTESEVATLTNKTLRLVTALGDFWMLQGLYSEGRRCLHTALELPQARRPSAVRSQSLLKHGNILCKLNVYDLAEENYLEALQIEKELGRKQQVAALVNCLGMVAREQNRPTEAFERFREALTIYQEIEDRQGEILCLNNLNELARHVHDFATAQIYSDSTQNARRNMRHEQDLAYALYAIASAALVRGDWLKAQSFFGQCLELQVKTDDRRGMVNTLEGIARMGALRNDLSSAVTLFAAVRSLRMRWDISIAPQDRDEYDRIQQHLRSLMKKPAYDAATRAGDGLSIEQALQLSIHSLQESKSAGSRVQPDTKAGKTS